MKPVLSLCFLITICIVFFTLQTVNCQDDNDDIPFPDPTPLPPTAEMEAYRDDYVPERSEKGRETKFPGPRDMEPFLGFDYYFRKADIVLSGMLSDQELRDRVEKYLYPNGTTSSIVKEDGTVEVQAVEKKKDHVLFFSLIEEVGAYYEFFMNYNATSTFSILTFSNVDYCAPFIGYPTCIDQTFCEYGNKILAHPRLKNWYTKNPCIVHEKLVPVPVGPKWQWYSPDPFTEDIKSIKSIYYRYGSMPLFYFKNFTIPSLQRQINNIRIRKTQKTEFVYNNFVHFTTEDPYYEPHKDLRPKIDDHFTKVLGIPKNLNRLSRDYIQELSKHKFAICPPGKGIDTHRTWEALMVGTIPIVLSSPIDKMFEGLPVLIVEDYSLVTTELLYQYYELFHKDQSFVFDKVYTFYWDKFIQ